MEMEVGESKSPFTGNDQRDSMTKATTHNNTVIDVGRNDSDFKNGRQSVYTAHNGGNSIKYMRKKGLPWILTVFSAIIVILFLILCFVLFSYIFASDSSESSNFLKYWPGANSASVLARFRNVAVVSDNGLCSEIGRVILTRGGNAVDSAIATTVCVGALNSHSSGIGGGFLMVFYNKFYGKCSTVDAREVAPLTTNRTTYVKNPSNAFTGYKSIGVPGEVAGLWQSYKRFGSGRVNWQDLIKPTVDLLNNGYPVSATMEKSLHVRNEQILTEPSMRNFFTNKATGKLYKEGEILQNPQLANTLLQISTSSDPSAFFYRGELAAQIAGEMREKGAFITQKDLEKYRAIVSDSPLESDALQRGANSASDEALMMCGPKSISGFAITQLIVAIMTKLFPHEQSSSIPYSSVDYYHKFVEAQKFAFALRSQLGDSKFAVASNALVENMTRAEFADEILSKMAENTLPSADDYILSGVINAQPNDHGTSHISVIDADGNAVSLTSSINNVFGAMVRSEKTGIIWNDQMDDFGIPGAKNFFGFEASESNFVEPGKRPMSSMTPLIVYDRISKNVRLNVGASGGSKIISAVAQVVLQTLNFNHTVKEAIDTPRIHNQFTPLHTEFEAGFSTQILDGLRERGQNLTDMVFPFANVHAILRDKSSKVLTANSDHRRAVYTYPTGY